MGGSGSIPGNPPYGNGNGTHATHNLHSANLASDVVRNPPRSSHPPLCTYWTAVKMLAMNDPLPLLRTGFLLHHGVTPALWSQHNVSRLLRQTGERPERVVEMRSILGWLGMGDRRWPHTGGIFDHGELFARNGKPVMIVGHPYGIDCSEWGLLTVLATYTTLRVSVDDEPGYYGFGTHHVRIELVEVLRPFKPMPATPKTRAAHRAARKAFAEADLDWTTGAKP
jgi:hypothetical protein